MDDESTLRPIQQVAAAAGISSRTLRHYDELDLLRPATTDGGGRRWYGPAEQRRLQRLLILRDLGLPLAEIAAVLDAERDEHQALRDHLDRLTAQRDRLEATIRTVRATLTRLAEGDPMDIDDLFDGITGHDPERQRAHEAEIADRYGAEVVADSRRRMAGLDREQVRAMVDGFAGLDRRMAAAMADGTAPDDPVLRPILDEHHRLVSLSWTPDAEAYAGLGELYVDSPEFVARYEAVRPGLAAYWRDAMAHHARTVLAESDPAD